MEGLETRRKRTAYHFYWCRFFKNILSSAVSSCDIFSKIYKCLCLDQGAVVQSWFSVNPGLKLIKFVYFNHPLLGQMGV